MPAPSSITVPPVKLVDPAPVILPLTVRLPVPAKTISELTNRPPATVISPAPLAVVVSGPPLESPRVKLLKSQAVAPPRLPAVSIVNVPPVKLISPSPVTDPPLTVILSVPISVALVLTAKSP